MNNQILASVFSVIIAAIVSFAVVLPGSAVRNN